MKTQGHRCSLLCPAVALVAGLATSSLHAASPGDLDPTFGSGGIVSTGGASTDEYAQQVIILPNGKLLVIGVASNGVDDDFAVLQFDHAGAPDPSFGTNGMLMIPVGSSVDRCYGAAVQADGKIVVVGSTWNGTENDFALVRLTAAGELDPTFGTGGIATISAPGIDGGRLNTVAIQNDGRIVGAGRIFAMDGSNGVSLAVLRFTASGTLDLTFGSDGIVTTTLGGTQAGAEDVVIQKDGRIVVAGYVRSADASFDNFAIARFTDSGAPDSTFGTAGVVVTAVNSDGADYAEALALQNDGRIVVAGQTYLGGGGDTRAFAVARYIQNGGLDPSFGTGGIVTTQVGNGYESASAVTVQADGKIVASGSCQTAGLQVFAAVRYTNTGGLDPSFAEDGIVTTAVGEYAAGYGGAVQPNGSIIVAGYSGRGSDSNFSLVRYLAGVPRPDARIGKSRPLPKGNDLYDPVRNAQTLRTILRPGRSKKIRIGIQNDSDTTAVFTIKGKRGNRAFKVRYLDGTTDVTRSIVSGSFTTRRIEPGQIARLSAEVRARANQFGKKRTLGIRATAEDGRTHDTVRIEARTRSKAS